MKKKSFKFFAKSLVTSIPCAKFGYGPFREIPLIPDDNIVFSNDILKKQIQASFPLLLKNTIKALEKGNMIEIKDIMRPRMSREIENLFGKDKNVSLQIINKHDVQVYTLEHVRGITKLFGFDISEFDYESIKARNLKDIFKGFTTKRFWLKPKGLLPKREWFQGVSIYDLVISTNTRVKISDHGKRGNVELLKQRDSGINTYTIQVMCKSEYERLPPPGILFEEEGIFNKGLKVEEKNHLKLQFLSLEKQKDYEANGWKINNINDWIESKGVIEDLL